MRESGAMIHEAQQMLSKQMQRKLASSPADFDALKSEIIDVLGPYLYDKTKRNLWYFLLLWKLIKWIKTVIRILVMRISGFFLLLMQCFLFKLMNILIRSDDNQDILKLNLFNRLRRYENMLTSFNGNNIDTIFGPISRSINVDPTSLSFAFISAMECSSDNSR